MNDKPNPWIFNPATVATDRPKSEILYQIESNPELVESARHTSSWIFDLKNSCESRFPVSGKPIDELSRKELIDAYASHHNTPSSETLAAVMRVVVFRDYIKLWAQIEAGEDRKGDYGPPKLAVIEIMKNGVSGFENILAAMVGHGFTINKAEEKLTYTDKDGTIAEVSFHRIENIISEVKKLLPPTYLPPSERQP